jgi:hypothetical protein
LFNVPTFSDGGRKAQHRLLFFYVCFPASETSLFCTVELERVASYNSAGMNPYARPLPPPRIPVTAANGRCNIGMPNNVFDRFLWVINYFARAGFIVVIDNHVWLEDPTAYENPKLWVESWAKLAAAVAKVRAEVWGRA